MLRAMELKGSAKLLADTAISRSDGRGDRPENPGGFDGDSERVEPMTVGGRRFGLHPHPQRKRRDSAE
jgi:hypothetical protein